MGAVEAVLSREGGRVLRCARDFSGAPRFDVAVLRSRGDAVREALREATAGRARVGGAR